MTVSLAKEGAKPDEGLGVGKMGFDENTKGRLGDYFIEYLEFLISYYSIGVVKSSCVPERDLEAARLPGRKWKWPVKATPLRSRLGSAR